MRDVQSGSFWSHQLSVNFNREHIKQHPLQLGLVNQSNNLKFRSVTEFKFLFQEYMKTYFSLFYAAINSGSLISTILTPILRQEVSCAGQETCYPAAFGVPAALMVVSICKTFSSLDLGCRLFQTKPILKLLSVILVLRTKDYFTT